MPGAKASTRETSCGGSGGRAARERDVRRVRLPGGIGPGDLEPVAGVVAEQQAADRRVGGGALTADRGDHVAGLKPGLRGRLTVDDVADRDRRSAGAAADAAAVAAAAGAPGGLEADTEEGRRAN